MKNKAFTLAEVLITLGIIGIVAALTMPSLIQKHKEKVTVVKLKKIYSVMSQAYLKAQQEHGTPEDWGIVETTMSGQSSAIITDILVQYLNVSKYCGRSKGCWYDSFTMNLGGTLNTNFNTHTDYSKILLADGTAIALYGFSVCANNYYGLGLLNDVCAKFVTDINGPSPPNTYGKDVFWFYLTNNGIVPMGTMDETQYSFSSN